MGIRHLQDFLCGVRLIFIAFTDIQTRVTSSLFIYKHIYTSPYKETSHCLLAYWKNPLTFPISYVILITFLVKRDSTRERLWHLAYKARQSTSERRTYEADEETNSLIWSGVSN